MTRTSMTFCPALFLVAAFATLLHAQVSAGPNRPKAVPRNYVITPNGYFHPTCVRELGKGDILLGEGRAIQHADGTLEKVPACQYPQYTARGRIVTPGARLPTITGYIEDATYVTSTSFGELTANWFVPSAPTSNDGQTVFLFPGMEDFNDVISILQPVLGWNAFSNLPAWSIASWNCCITGTTFHSTPVGVNPGDLILGEIQSTCAAGVLSCPSWNISMEDENTLSTTTLSGSSSDGQTFNWAFAGALEVDGLVQCTDYPPNRETYFFNIALYDYNFDRITSPGWSFSNLSSGLTPQCGYGGGVNSPTQVTLDYGAVSIWWPAIQQLLQN